MAKDAKRKPDLLCIGAQKAGTTWLYAQLGSRPDVFVPPVKELHFFNHKFVADHRRWTRWIVQKSLRETTEALRRDGRLDAATAAYLDRLGQEPMLNGNWYQFAFSPAGRHRICLDVTPEYCCIPDEGVAFVARFLPRARFVYLIRHPWHRAVSNLRMNVSRLDGFDGSEAAWLAAARNPTILERGRYSEYLPRWQRAFGPDRLLVLPYGRIAREPARMLAEIEDFAGLPRHGYASPGRVVNAGARLTPPEAAVEWLRRATLPEVAFLCDRLGEDFLART
jgi:hypothetical protein